MSETTDRTECDLDAVAAGMNAQRQIDPRRDARLTASLAAMVRSVDAMERRREASRPRYRMAIIGWVQMDVRFFKRRETAR